MAVVNYKGALINTNSKAYELFQDRGKSPQHEKALQKHLESVHDNYLALSFGGNREAYKLWKESNK